MEPVTIDPSGIGVDDQPLDARIRISVNTGEREVSIYGTCAGLEFVAKQILRIAHSELEMHTRLDQESHHPIYEADSDLILTIGCDDKRWRCLQNRKNKSHFAFFKKETQ